MPNLGSTLDTLIAVVIVLLLLSLVVQSIQAGIKKLFKIKAREIEDSLVYLLENALGGSRVSQTSKAAPAAGAKPSKKVASDGPRTRRWYNRSPFLRAILMLPDTPGDTAHPEVKKLLDAIRQRFRDVGRISQYGNCALESISKEDLSKVLASVEVGKFIDEAESDIRDACASVVEAKTFIDEIDKALTSGEVQLKWASLRDAVAPLVNDVCHLFDVDRKTFKVTLLVSHVLELRKIDLSRLIELASAVRAQLSQQQPVNAALLADFDKLIENLRTVPAKIDEALAPVKARITAVETWYDTVMQSFEERYTRSMRTFSFVIGLIVAVVLNANIFQIYRRLENDGIARQRVFEAQKNVIEEYEKKPAASAADEITKTQEAAKGEKDEKKKKALEERVAALQKDPLGTWKADLQADLQSKTDQYSAFNFAPFPWGKADWKKNLPSAIAGWLSMALLLTLGAPFWHDVLESLFGFKSLLQKRSETKTSEQKSGQGGTQPT